MKSVSSDEVVPPSVSLALDSSPQGGASQSLPLEGEVAAGRKGGQDGSKK